MTFWFFQLLNGLSFGMLLFLLAAGLSLIFGVMRILNLAHGSYYLLGAYVALSVVEATAQRRRWRRSRASPPSWCSAS